MEQLNNLLTKFNTFNLKDKKPFKELYDVEEKVEIDNKIMSQNLSNIKKFLNLILIIIINYALDEYKINIILLSFN